MRAEATLDQTSPSRSSGTLCRQFLSVARNQLTGTLTVTNTSGARKSFLCLAGSIADVDAERGHGLLTEAILSCETVPPRHMKRAQKLAEKNDTSAGIALLELELVPEEDVLRYIEVLVADEVSDVFTWELADVHFTQHSGAETLEDFDAELSDYFELRGEPEDLFLEACHRLGDWDLVEEHFDLLLDVFYATPGTFHYFREPDVYPIETRVLGAIDGTKDVAEVIAASGLDSFEALKMVRVLVSQGEIELINPVQMFQLGSDLAAEGSLDKAAKLFQRAKERGLNDFDLELRLGETLDKLGRKKEAALWYLEYSSSCLGQLRVDDAVNALRRVITMCPDNEVAGEKLLEIHLQQRRASDALAVGLKLANRKCERGASREALNLLLSMRNLLSGETRFHEKLVELAEDCGEHDIAKRERQLLAQTFDERKDAQSALETYQSMFCEHNDSLEVRVKLVELHVQQGNHQKAIDHINGILALGGKRRIKDPEVLRDLHGKMVQLKPGDGRSSRWLVDDALARDDKAAAIVCLEAWRKQLERDDDPDELVDVLERLISLDDRLDHRLALASVLEDLGRGEEGRRQLRSYANLAARRKDFGQAEKTLEHALRAAPFDVSTRMAQADLLDSMGRGAEAAERLEEVALLAVVAGNVQEAEECCRRVLVSDPNAADVVDRLGGLCLALGDHQKAVEQFLKAAKIHIANRNCGLARRAVDRLLRAHPGHAEGTTLFDELAAMEARYEHGPASSGNATTARSPTPSTERSAPADSAPAVKTSIKGITARLKNLKSGDAEPPGKGTSKVANIAAKLGGLRAQAAERDGPQAADDTSEPDAAVAASAGDAQLATPPTASSQASPATPSGGGALAAGSVQSAAARLKALAAGGGATEPETPASEASEADESDGAAAAPPPTPQPAANQAPGHAPATGTTKLGGAAGRLAALRKQGMG